jgi:hypothetical protein
MAMAEELSTGEFSLDLTWPPKAGEGGNLLLDASLGRFQVTVDGKSVTSYRTEKGDTDSYLHVPLYHLTEWVALNWWAFLHEPRKLETEEAERDFRSRHWLGMARNGFALPDVFFSPSGETIEIAARPTFLRFAQLSFLEGVIASVPVDNVRSAFTDFIDQVLTHLTEKGIRNSVAHNAWQMVKQTSADEEAYCRLIGSLGASPYIEHPEIDAELEEIADKISVSMLTDLCQATNVGNFNRCAEFTEGISQALAKATSAQIDDLLEVPKPADKTARAYEWGYRATDAARAALGIADDDPSGANAFFELLNLDPTIGIQSETANSSLISGAVDREDGSMRLSLSGADQPHRKFAAARASFLAWSPDRSSSRLVTTARTRDQRASRAFAAELLAPSKFLKKLLGDRTDVSPFTLDKIAGGIGIAPTVVHYQARNHGYNIAEVA